MGRGALFAVVLICAGCAQDRGYEPRNGDIVFQTSRSSQSLAIQPATKSPYSHMGIVYIREGEPFVFEAVQPVKLTPLRTWIDRGERGHFVANAKVEERYGDDVPLDEVVVSPVAIFNSADLTTVYEN